MIVSEIIFNSYPHRAALDVTVLPPLCLSAARLAIPNLDFNHCIQAKAFIGRVPGGWSATFQLFISKHYRIGKIEVQPRRTLETSGSAGGSIQREQLVPFDAC